MNNVLALRPSKLYQRLAVGLLAACLVAQPLLTTAATTTGPTTTAPTPIKDSLVLLVPNNPDLASWQIKVWTDTAQDLGLRMQVMTDSQFLALGTAAATTIAGLVMPDSAHVQASDAVVAAVKQYANLGGKLMLVYDAGVLTDGGYFATGKSRFSDIAGVDYAMYDTLADRMVGFGPVLGTQARLDSLQLPPGKYAPWTAPTTLLASASLTTLAAARTTSTSTSTTYVTTSPTDPGGTRAMQLAIQTRAMAKLDEASTSRTTSLRISQSLSTDPAIAQAVASKSLKTSSKVTNSSNATTLLSATTVASPTTTTTTATSSTTLASPMLATAAATTTTSTASTQINSITSYGFGTINYFSFVTQGTYSGSAYLSSPDFGLVSGVRTTGSGRVMFVNLPLGFFKAIGTDSAPMHGFLNLFASEQVGLPRMSTQPAGVAGMVYNWHVDDGDDLQSDVKYLLDNTSVLKRGPFSMHFTAGVDVVTLGDGMGMHLDTDATSQDLVRRLGNIGSWAGQLPVQHELGAHGGWNHDLYGLGANETNQSTYQPWLELNFAAVERITGRKVREYSAPQGNNPSWAVQWLENRGVNSMYFVGDTGTAALRSWRAGSRLTNSMWVFPITPLGQYATFEEFEIYGVTDTASSQWLVNLENFVVKHRTNRLFYSHPPGVRAHLNAVQPMISYADSLIAAGKFRWYTMSELAGFSQRRIATTWSATPAANGALQFTASHPTSLKDMTWTLPRSKYASPRVSTGNATVKADNADWLVIATGGTQLRFSATPL